MTAAWPAYEITTDLGSGRLRYVARARALRTHPYLVIASTLTELTAELGLASRSTGANSVRGRRRFSSAPPDGWRSFRPMTPRPGRACVRLRLDGGDCAGAAAAQEQQNASHPGDEGHDRGSGQNQQCITRAVVLQGVAAMALALNCWALRSPGMEVRTRLNWATASW